MLTPFHVRTLALGSVAAVAVALGAALAIPGCTVLTNDALPDDGGAFEGSTLEASTACGTCVAQECLGPWAVCLTDDACQKLRGCDNPFTEGGGRSECFCAGSVPPDGGASFDPLAAYAAFASCNDARTCGKCSTDCASACPAGAPLGTPTCTTGDAGSDADAASADAGDASDASDAAVVPPVRPSVDGCAQCVSGNCGSASKLCAIGTECAAFLVCAKGCIGASCADACGNEHSTGKASAKELSSCTLTSCRSACGL